MMDISNTRIVLVEPQHPGNIGAAARAMKTMGLSDLALVTPRQFPHAEATARASGADDLLANAACVDSLQAAVADCQLVVATSARSRHLAWELVAPDVASQRVVEQSRSGPVAVVFGRERSGLRNDELEVCNLHLRIPTNDAFASLNLAAAVQVVCYELRRAGLAADALRPVAESDNEQGLATSGQMEGLYAHFQDVLIASGFLDPDEPKLLMRRLRRLFNRARPHDTEVNILRGILNSLDPRRQQ